MLFLSLVVIEKHKNGVKVKISREKILCFWHVDEERSWVSESSGRRRAKQEILIERR